MPAAEVSVPIPVDLARARPWHRFAEPAESRYQLWLSERVAPLGLLIAWLSLALWLGLPFLTVWALGDDTPDGIWLLELVFQPSVLILWILLLRSGRTRRFAVAWSAIAQVAVAGLTLYGVRGLFGITEGGAVYTAMFFSMLSPVVRSPVRVAAATTTLLMGAAVAIMAYDIRHDSLSLVDAWPSFSFVGADILIVTAVSLLAEHSSRNAWAQDQIIERQQLALIESRRLIKRYVPPSVADQIEAGRLEAIDTPVRRRVTVLFSDVVGFTSMADRLDPESLTEVINDYLGAVADIVEEHGGTLNEFAGDGFMAVFGAPGAMEPEAQVIAALAAARAVHARLPELNSRWERLGVDQPVLTRIGINTGVLSVGTFGSAGRATYTAIGLQTNIAARIQAQCEPGAILLSQGSWNLVKDHEACEFRGEVEVKGVHFPIGLYQPSTV